MQLSTRLQKLWSSGIMDGSIHTAATKKRTVGSVDYHVHVQTGDVADHDADTLVDMFVGRELGGWRRFQLAALIELGQSRNVLW
jgi:hypothetical protein